MQFENLSVEPGVFDLGQPLGQQAWALIEYFEVADVRSFAERGTEHIDISLLYSSLAVLRRELMQQLVQGEMNFNLDSSSSESNDGLSRQAAEVLMSAYPNFGLPEQRRATGRFLAVGHGMTKSSFSEVEMVSCGFSPIELVGILDESLLRFEGTLADDLELLSRKHSKVERHPRQSEIPLGRLLSKLDYHPLEPGLDFYDAWALIMSCDSNGKIHWNVAQSSQVDKTLLTGLMSQRIKELRTWMEDTYSEDEENPYISETLLDELTTEHVAFSDIRDPRLEGIILEIDPDILSRKIIWASVWIMGGDAERGAYTNFVNAENRVHANRDQSGHMELGALLVERERVLRLLASDS